MNSNIWRKLDRESVEKIVCHIGDDRIFRLVWSKTHIPKSCRKIIMKEKIKRIISCDMKLSFCRDFFVIERRLNRFVYIPGNFSFCVSIFKEFWRQKNYEKCFQIVMFVLISTRMEYRKSFAEAVLLELIEAELYIFNQMDICVHYIPRREGTTKFFHFQNDDDLIVFFIYFEFISTLSDNLIDDFFVPFNRKVLTFTVCSSAG